LQTYGRAKQDYQEGYTYKDPGEFDDFAKSLHKSQVKKHKRSDAAEITGDWDQNTINALIDQKIKSEAANPGSGRYTGHKNMLSKYLAANNFTKHKAQLERDKVDLISKYGGGANSGFKVGE